MCDSNAAYDRMTLQVEQTAAELRALVAKRDFKCLAEISAANQRAATAESELKALRATLGVQSERWLQSPVEQCTACTPAKFRAANTHLLSQPDLLARSLESGAAVNPNRGPAGALNPLL